MRIGRDVTADELKTLVGALDPKWVFVLVGERLFCKITTLTWYEYPRASDEPS